MVEGFSVGKRKRRTLCGTAFFRKRLLAELQLIERNEFNDSPVFNCLQKLPALNGSDVPGLKNKKAQGTVWLLENADDFIILTSDARNDNLIDGVGGKTSLLNRITTEGAPKKDAKPQIRHDQT